MRCKLTRFITRLLFPFLPFSVAVPAAASEAASGTFTASRACDAFRSFRNQTNPGQVKTVPGTTYDVSEINSRNWEWIRIHIPGASDSPRWVSRDCGTAQLGAAMEQAARDSRQCNIKNQHDSYVLAMSWQPGFCEHFPYEGKKPECDALSSRRLETSHLTLHGLWPNRKSCGTSYGNCPGPALQLEKATIEKIAPWMPNFFFETKFGAYEWKKHGTCQSLEDDAYFLTAVDAVRVVNDSAAGRYLRENIGKAISAKRFFDHVRNSHGEEIAGKITLVCAKGRFLQEVRISLPLGFRTDGGIEKLAGGAKPAPEPTSKCGSDQIYIERSGPN